MLPMAPGKAGFVRRLCLWFRLPGSAVSLWYLTDSPRDTVLEP